MIRGKLIAWWWIVRHPVKAAAIRRYFKESQI